MKKEVKFESILKYFFIFLHIKNKICIFTEENSDLKYNLYGMSTVDRKHIGK